ncbi:RING finger protein 223 [Gadus morhua]|uniref:RING finger protein 223 n=1 Tax=Gadus morhua TaxID=8049 RepID=UPI0011B7B08D|nr:RING finger protein 223 [Gadus morhua]
MDQPQQVWSTQLDPGPGEAGPSGGAPGEGDGDSRASVCSQPECSICFNTYDNVFKTPKLLDCTHTFCLECLSRLMAVTGTPDQDQGAGGGADGSAVPAPGQLSCPFCRQHTTLSELGPPALATSREVLCKLPRHQQQEEPVWLEGEKLCYKSPDPDAGGAQSAGRAPSSSFCICIDIGANKAAEAAAAPGQRRRSPGVFERLTDWKRLLVFVLLTLVLVVVVLWPLQCILTTGNMHCKTIKPVDGNTPSPTTTPALALSSFGYTTAASDR